MRKRADCEFESPAHSNCNTLLQLQLRKLRVPVADQSCCLGARVHYTRQVRPQFAPLQSPLGVVRELADACRWYMAHRTPNEGVSDHRAGAPLRALSASDALHDVYSPNIPGWADHGPAGDVWARMLTLSPATVNVDLYLNETTFGRRQVCDVVIAHPSISGYHCTIARGGAAGPTVVDFRYYSARYVATDCAYSHAARMARGSMG